jgi:hypothetical protein
MYKYYFIYICIFRKFYYFDMIFTLKVVSLDLVQLGFKVVSGDIVNTS